MGSLSSIEQLQSLISLWLLPPTQLCLSHTPPPRLWKRQSPQCGSWAVRHVLDPSPSPLCSFTPHFHSEACCFHTPQSWAGKLVKVSNSVEPGLNGASVLSVAHTSLLGFSQERFVGFHPDLGIYSPAPPWCPLRSLLWLYTPLSFLSLGSQGLAHRALSRWGQPVCPLG